MLVGTTSYYLTVALDAITVAVDEINSKYDETGQRPISVSVDMETFEDLWPVMYTTIGDTGKPDTYILSVAGELDGLRVYQIPDDQLTDDDMEKVSVVRVEVY